MTVTERPPAAPDRPSPVPDDDRITGALWATLLVLCGTVFLEGLDVSMMGVALPSIREDLVLSTSSLQWVVSAYVLGYGGFVLLGGRAADLLGRRRTFLAALAAFIAFSGLGGLATESWILIASRFATGVSAGFLTPASLSIITTNFREGEQRNKALLVYGGISAAGFSLGMFVGGLLASIHWRWVFFAPVVVASVIYALAVHVLPRGNESPPDDRRIDLAGAITLTAAMLLLVFGVVRLPDVPAAQTAAVIAASVGLLAVFVAIERRTARPLVRLGILRSRELVRADVGAMLFVGSFVAFQFIVVLYLQELRDWSSLETGLALMVAGLDAIIAPTITPWFVRRFGNTPVIVAGMLVGLTAYVLFLPLQADWSYAAMLPALVLIGVAFAFVYGPLTIAATAGVDESEQGLAGGMLNASVQFGAALILAIVTSVNVSATDGTTPDAMLDGYRAALIVPVVTVAIATVVMAAGLRRRRAAGADTTIEPAVASAA